VLPGKYVLWICNVLTRVYRAVFYVSAVTLYTQRYGKGVLHVIVNLMKSSSYTRDTGLYLAPVEFHLQLIKVMQYNFSLFLMSPL
jgi:hypothetical protein